jgi:hypothetical protein
MRCAALRCSPGLQSGEAGFQARENAAVDKLRALALVVDVTRGILTRAKALTYRAAILAGFKTRFPGLKSGATPHYTALHRVAACADFIEELRRPFSRVSKPASPD